MWWEEGEVREEEEEAMGKRKEEERWIKPQNLSRERWNDKGVTTTV